MANENKQERGKYIKIGATAFGVVAAGLLFYYILFHFDTVTENLKSFFKTIEGIVFGLVISYLLCPILNYLELHIFNINKYKTKGRKRIRIVSIIITMILFIGLFYGLISLILPEIIRSIYKITSSYKEYEDNFMKWYNSLLLKYPELKAFFNDEDYAVFNEKLLTYLSDSLLPKLEDIIKNFTSGIFTALRVLVNFLIGIIMSVYLLYNKELFTAQSKKMIYAFMKRSTANNFIHNIRYINKTFINFLIGKIADSIIIGFLCFILTTIIGTPYSLLISVIIGITNIIPLFGPFIGAVPCAFLVLLVDPKQCLYFIIMIIILQQFDGNILGPKIIGSSTGLSGFWVLVALTVFGTWFGLIGWIVGVPLFAVIYTTIKAYVNAKLSEKNLNSETNNYMNVNYIDDEHNFIKIPREEVVGVSTKFKAIKPKMDKNRNNTYNPLMKIIHSIDKRNIDENEDEDNVKTAEGSNDNLK